MKLKIPPPIIFLFSLGLMFGLHFLFADLAQELPYRKTLSRVLLVVGVLIVIAGMLAFRLHNTTTNPLKPKKTTHLVTSGIYQFTRNPMYLGMVLILLGGSIRIGNPLSIIGIIFFIWYLTRFQIKPEEEALMDLFEQDYKEYCSRVRRWI